MRKSNSIKNFFTSIFPYIIMTFLSVFRVKVFLNSMGEEIYAVNQLFNQVFTYLSLVEGGVGSLIVQKYYKFFVKKSEKDIITTYSKSVKTMKKIFIVVLFIGFILSFFIKLFAQNSLSYFYMQFIFMLYLFRSVMEYLFISPRFVIQADQKLYKINLIIYVYKFVEIIVEIILLQFGLDYIFILIITIIIRLLSFYSMNKKVFKEYPWLKKVDVTGNEKFEDVGDMFWHKISGNIKLNTDVILLSITQTPFIVSVYTSYNYIIKCICEMVYLISNSILSSFGDAVYRENNENSYNIFKKINLAFLFIASFICVVTFLVIDDFITIWVGSKYLFDIPCVILLIIILFQNITLRPMILSYEALGLYKETKSLVAIEAMSNLILSLILLKPLGTFGVIFATFISGLISSIIFPSFVHKKIFNKPIKNYIFTYILSIVINVSLTIILFFLTNLFMNDVNWFSFILKTLIISIVSLLLLFVIYYVIYKDFRKMVNELLLMIKSKGVVK